MFLFCFLLILEFFLTLLKCSLWWVEVCTSCTLNMNPRQKGKKGEKGQKKRKKRQKKEIKKKKRTNKQKHETQRDVEVVPCHSGCVSSRKLAWLRLHLHIHAPVVLVVLLFASGGHNSRVRDPGGVHARRAQHEGVGEPGGGGRQKEWVQGRTGGFREDRSDKRSSRSDGWEAVSSSRKTPNSQYYYYLILLDLITWNGFHTPWTQSSVWGLLFAQGAARGRQWTDEEAVERLQKHHFLPSRNNCTEPALYAYLKLLWIQVAHKVI